RIAIAGFNGLPFASLVTPALTTIVSPRLEIGRIAARQLIERIGGRTPAKRRVDVSFQMQIREST
ncbi:MAG: substrate-binding domain-containing protein, partial [Luteibacter sp.]